MRSFGPVTVGALLGVIVSLCIPGIPTLNPEIQVLYYTSPVLIGIAGGICYEALLRKGRGKK
jgi:hypothetical protein